ENTVVAKWKEPSESMFEVGGTGYYDFPFSNPHPVAYRIGVNYQSCKCARVEACTFAPETVDKLKRRSVADGAALAAASFTGARGAVTQGAVDESLLRDALGATVKWHELHNEHKADAGGSLTVEPNTSGIIRVVWVGKSPGPMRQMAKVWSQAQGG